ncbi:hypothetical protein K2173_020937 [Erythroxylum novogranatense]|uniref:MIF4G domain-containing protein n=1 Tax=Erythroxylum novogranatense TaxID=1862640 RepID=A0AAV8TM63_9ROSI|nr:hypothetical protein K2173_020937 [Erythroxylum novogranatense]
MALNVCFLTVVEEADSSTHAQSHPLPLITLLFRRLLLPLAISLFCALMEGPTPSLVKAEVPWSARRRNRVLKTVKEILNNLTPEKFDLLKGQLIDSGITSADILKDVVSLIFDKAVMEPTFCPMYAQLCAELN